MQAGLRCPNIVTFYDFIEYERRLYLMMEYVDGPSLEARIRQAGGMPAAEALTIFQPVVEALDYTHRQVVVASMERYWQYYLIALASVLFVVVAIAVRPMIQGEGSNGGGMGVPSGPTHSVTIDIYGNLTTKTVSHVLLAKQTLEEGRPSRTPGAARL